MIQLITNSAQTNDVLTLVKVAKLNFYVTTSGC